MKSAPTDCSLTSCLVNNAESKLRCALFGIPHIQISLTLKLQLHDAIYRLRFYSNSLIHILSLSNSHNNLASIQKNRGNKSHRVIVALDFFCCNILFHNLRIFTLEFYFMKKCSWRESNSRLLIESTVSYPPDHQDNDAGKCNFLVIIF